MPPLPASSPATAGATSATAAGTATESRSALRLRQSLVVALAVVSGATDAIGLLALGGAFTSVMTGNMVLLGVSAASHDGSLARSSGLAILAFCAGAALGARLAGSARADDPVWPRAVTRGLAVELAFFAVYATGFWIAGAEPRPGLQTLLLLCTAVGLGIQSSTVQRFGVSGMSTTYLTGTLTTVVMRLATGRGVREVWHSIEILLGLIGGAAAGAALITLAPTVAPLLQLSVLAAVVLVGRLVAQRIQR